MLLVGSSADHAHVMFSQTPVDIIVAAATSTGSTLSFNLMCHASGLIQVMWKIFGNIDAACFAVSLTKSCLATAGHASGSENLGSVRSSGLQWHWPGCQRAARVAAET